MLRKVDQYLYGDLSIETSFDEELVASSIRGLKVGPRVLIRTTTIAVRLSVEWMDRSLGNRPNILFQNTGT